jgi:hypothetical protein
VGVTEASQYCAWLRRRLPGEAEWQRAADVAAADPRTGLVGFGAGFELVRGRFALSDADAGPLALLFPTPERWGVIRGSFPGGEPSLRVPFEGRSESVGFRCARSPGVPEVPTQAAEPAAVLCPRRGLLSRGGAGLGPPRGSLSRGRALASARGDAARHV